MQVFAQVLYYYGLIQQNTIDRAKVICPFHQDIKPSMIVDLVQETYYCFGCHARGGPIDFIKQVEKCDDIQAYVQLNHIMKSKTTRNIIINVQPQISVKEGIEEARHYFYTLPDTNWKDQPKDHYLFKRGFTPKVLSKLDIRVNYNHIYGVVAPMLDLGRFKGYVCRATLPEIDRKYLYNKGFSRSNTLVGSYTKHWPIITEGYLDYAKLVQFGHPNSCAILGWKATNQQISKIQKYTNCVVSALDNTASGKAGTDYLKEFFHVVRFQFQPHIKDIGDLDQYDWNLAWSKTKQKILNYKE